MGENQISMLSHPPTDDFGILPLLKFQTHVLKGPIMLSLLIESACIGGLLFLHLSPYFSLFLLTFVPTTNQELAKLVHQKQTAIAYLPFLVGTVFGVFFISTFSHAGVSQTKNSYLKYFLFKCLTTNELFPKIKKTVWSMVAKNLLFVYVWSLIFDWKLSW